MSGVLRTLIWLEENYRNNGFVAMVVFPLLNWFNIAVSPEEGAETSV
jgi:hypothetical protein